MKKINHHIYKQKDLHEFWASEWGWLHIGDLVRLPQRLGATGLGTRPAMVIGFFYDPRFDDGSTMVGVRPAHEPAAVWFIDFEHCSPAGAQ